MLETYVQKSRKAHFESFANKIFTGIKEINPVYAERRAIWELFQNAIDLIDNNGELCIERTDLGFKFIHNGKPFKDDNLGALVKQYSNGKTYGSNGEQVGQYGTGFLSTHVYGKEILLSGSVQGADGNFRALDEFKIDRTAVTPELLTLALMDQDDTIALLCDGSDNLIENPSTITCFHYISKGANMGSIDNMLIYVKTLLPYIFCFNEKLNFVIINDGIEEYKYEKLSNDKGTLIIKVDEIAENNIIVKYLETQQEKIKVIFPQPNHNFSLVPKQFLFYPLMETVEIGVNFLVHAQEFKPNKERDYLHKKEINEDVKKDVAVNKDLLTKVYDLIIEKIKVDESLNFLDTTNLLFVDNDVDFEKELKKKYIDEVKCLKRVKVGDDFLDITKISFFDKELLTNDETFTTNLYTVLSDFCILPPYETFIYLSTVVNNWIDGSIDGLKVNNLKEVCKMISDGCNSSYDSIKGKESFISVLKIISTDVELLKEVPLIPNIHHQLKSFDKLRRWDVVEDSLINIFDSLCSSETENYLHPDFYFISTITPYTRENFKDDFAKFCNNELNSFINGYDRDSSYPVVRISMLTFWLCNFIGLNRSSDLNKQLFSFFNETLKLDLVQGEISSPTVGINYQPAFKLLSRIYVKSLNSEGVIFIESNKDKLLELIGYLNSNLNLKDELLDKLPCFPDQSYNLKSQSEVKIDEVIDGEFKDQYFKITGNQIREKMVLPDFEIYLEHKNSISGLELGDEIETKLSPKKVFLPIHSDDDVKAKEEYSILLKTLLELIQFISKPDSQWGNWLKSIDQVKEEILMHRFKDKATRLSLFSILSENEDKINLLGRLAKIPNLEALIKAGEEKQQEENRKNNHLNYINYIGLLIQNLIEKQLEKELADVVSVMESEKDTKLTTKEEQNGQDFIIYKNNNPIYYLEVKSKWDENGRFALSKNQTERCASNKNAYAVITVNVDRYKKEYTIDKEDISFDDLKDFVRVNDDLGEYFEKLISENIIKAELTEPKLIEYRGSIPQKIIDDAGSKFDAFLQKLINKIKRPDAITD